MEIVSAQRRLHCEAAAFVLALAAPCASAMGGHFEVDDAAVLAPGRCQVELWSLRGEEANVAHIGPGCRVGPLEVNVHFERLSGTGRSDRVVGALLKAATDWLPELTIALVGAASRDTSQGVNLWSAYVPVTWALGATVQLSGNLGVDRLGDRGTTPRWGLAVEWAPDDRFTLLAERLNAFDATLTRVGLRIALGESASLDLSGGRLSGSGNRLWGLGLTFEFSR